MLRVVFAAVMAMAAFSAIADTWTDSSTGYTWTYTASGGAVEISEVSPWPLGSVTIPARLGGKLVVSIGPYAFCDCSELTSVTIPDSVTSIGDGAFWGCIGLTSVTIPDSVTSINEHAFSDCSGLTSVTIPDSVTSINEYAFSDCSGLTSVTIPDSVTSISFCAFSGCSGLTSITIPNSVTNIGEDAFCDCSGLKSVTIPDSVTSINACAFSNCSGLTSVTIPDSVTSISLYAFSGCSGLTNINVDVANVNYSSANGVLLSKDGKSLVLGVNGEVIIPDSVTCIGPCAFGGCSGLTSVTIPNSVTSIREDAFSHCSGLTSVTIPNSVTSIWGSVFSFCSGLTNFNVDAANVNYSSANGVLLSKDGKTLVQGVNGDVIIPDSVTTIGGYTFSGCSRLTSVTIPNSVTSIGNVAFYGCSGLTNVAIPQCVCDIRLSHVFWSCYQSIANVVILDGVTSIGPYAFDGCSGLKSVTIPDSVRSIGGGAFSGCSGLKSVTIPTSVMSVGDDAFSDCSGLTSLTIPNSVTSIGAGAFSGCSGLASVTIPIGVTNIGGRAFGGCENIKTVSLPISENAGPGLIQAKFNAVFDVTSGVEDADDVSTVSGAIAAYQRVTSRPWKFSDPVTGKTFAWNDSSSTFAYFGEMYMEAGKTYVFGAHFDDYAYVKVDGQVLINVQCNVSLHTGQYLCEETGWHAVEFRLGDISGNKGSWGQVWSGDFGLGYRDDGGTDASQSAWKRLLDPGDGRLLRVSGMPSHLSEIFPDSYRTIQEVIILDGTEIISDGFFAGGTGLANVSIPDSVTSIERGAFSGCSGLTSVTIPNSVTRVGNGAFDGCIGLTSVKIPQYVCDNSLSNVFSSCYQSIANVVILEGVTSIEAGAFSGCSGLTSVTIPNSVMSVGDDAFCDCRGLASVKIPQYVCDNSLANVFPSCFQSIANVVILDGVTSIGAGAFSGCSGLTSITIPNSVTNIGERAFCDCSGLKSVTIPDSVTSIESGAFSGCSGLMSVNIPNSVMSIGDDAFSACSGLTSVIISDGVTSIGEDAFSYCSGLTSITIPDSVTSIAVSAFSYCCGLTNINVDSANVSYSSANGVLLSKDGKTLVHGVNGVVVIPNSVKNIGARAFCDCSRLTSVTIPDSVTGIGVNAFSGCSGLTSITIPNSVMSVGDGAFDGCSGLTSVTIPQYVCDNSLSNVFSSCYQSITNVVILDGVTSIGAGAFSGCSGVTRVTIPNSVTSVAVSAFSYCCGLTNINVDSANVSYSSANGVLLSKDGKTLVHGVNGVVVIPNSVKNIGARAFCDCSRLTSVTIPDSVTGIGVNAFSGCSGLTSITIPNSVMSVGDGAFDGCSGLTSVTIPQYVCDNSLSNVFSSCYQSITNVVILDGVTSIGAGAFSGCSGLTSVTIPNSVTNIGERAFCDCSGLAGVTIPDSVTSIERGAFSGCSGFTSVTIPNSVTSIGDNAFSDCSGLASATIPESVKCVGARTFSGCYNIRTVSLSICDRSKPGLMQAKFNAEFDVTSGVEDADDVSMVSGAIAAYQRVTSRPWKFSDPVTGETFAWNDSSSTFAYFGEMYMEAGKTYVFGAHFDDYAYVKVDGQVLINVQCNVSLHTGQYLCEETGWHAVEFRLGDISGNKGSWGQVWSGDFGLGYRDDGGTDASQSAWKRLLDPGDGRLLRVSGMPSHLSEIFPDSYRTIQEVIILDGTETISDGFFAGCTGLANVSIPDGVTSIERGSFSGCRGLTGVTIPDSVTSIGENAFSGCENLTSVSFSGSVTNVDSSAFSGCVNLTRVTLADCMIRNGAMADLFPSFRKIQHVDFVGNIASLPENFFDGCDSLESVSVGEGVFDFGDNDMRWAVGSNPPNGLFVKDGWVFGCVGAEPSSIVIPEGVKGIAPYALCDLYDLESVQLPSTLKYIGTKAFAGDSYLDDLVIPDGVEAIGDGAFEDCSYIQTLTLGSGVKSVGRRAFAGCTQLASAEFAEGLLEVGDEAFSNCWRMASVSLPLSTTNVGCMAFADCASLAGVTVPTHCGAMRDWFAPVFQNIQSVTVPEGETSVMSNMFDGCSALVSVQLPDGIVDIGESAFRDCLSLTEMAIPGSVTSLGVGAFEGCSNIATLSLPNGLTELPDGVFSGCDAVSSFVVPASVTNLGSRFCSSGTTAIYYLGNAPAYAEDAYADAPDSLTSYVVRGTKGWDGRPTSRDIPQSWIGHAITTWEATRFDVVFDANGGLFMPDGTNTCACEEITDTSYSLPPAEPVRAGYKFIGYWTERTAGSRVTSGTCVTLTKAHTLYAHWQVGAKVLVRFNACGGVVDPGEAFYPAEAPYGELPVPTREHYRFTGWWTTGTGGREATVASEVPRSDHELFAHWEPAPCVIRFHACNGTTSMCDQEFVYGEPVTLDVNSFARDGYAFAGWATAEGGQSVYPDGKTLADVAGLQNDVLHLYAVWMPIEYSVHFDPNGGSGEMADLDMVYDVARPLAPNAFVRSGYEFGGWATSGGDDAIAVYAEGETVENLSAEQDGTVTLFATWNRLGVATPVVTPVDGTVFTGDSCEVTITCDTEGAVIYYTTNGVSPRLTDKYRYAGAFTISHTVTIKTVAVLDDVKSDYATATITKGALTLGMAASGNSSGAALTWTTGGDAQWTPEVDSTSATGFAAQSGVIGDATGENFSATWLQTVVSGGGTVSFRWKVDCEWDDSGDMTWDHAAFYTNGVEAARMDGNSGWETLSFVFDDPGSHTLRWVFMKDDYNDEPFPDRAWVSGFTWSPTGGVGALAEWLAERSLSADAQMANGRTAAECYALGLDPFDATSDFRITGFQLDGDIPKVEWEPKTNKWTGIELETILKGTTALEGAGEWQPVTEENKAGMRFFKVEVVLP